MDPPRALTTTGEAIGVIPGGAHESARIRDTPSETRALGILPSVGDRILETILDAGHVRGAPRDVATPGLEADRALIGDIVLGEDLI